MRSCSPPRSSGAGATARRSSTRPPVPIRISTASAPESNNFRYLDVDADGRRCPFGAHIRRSNPRDALGWPGLNDAGLLSFRHRVIRRGMPYGPPLPADVLEDDGIDRGLVFVCFNASISRQFESVQLQWLNDGNGFHLGHDSDFLLGSPLGTGKMTIQGDPPFMLSPQAAVRDHARGRVPVLAGDRGAAGARARAVIPNKATLDGSSSSSEAKRALRRSDSHSASGEGRVVTYPGCKRRRSDPVPLVPRLEGSMGLELLSAEQTDKGMTVTFGTEQGIQQLVGSPDEMARLARSMQQVAALGQLNEQDSVWLDAVPVGDAIVKLGINPGGQARVLILRP